MHSYPDLVAGELGPDSGTSTSPGNNLIRHLTRHFPTACPACLLALSVIVRNPGPNQHGERIARMAGHRSRRVLNQALGRHGFPPWHVVRDWIRFLEWLANWERTATPLVRQAWACGSEPSVYYRAVKRLTTKPWSSAREQGLAYWVKYFATSVAPNVHCVSSVTNQGTGTQ